LKSLSIAISKVPPRSPEQQTLVLRMANKASNGEELLVVRAAVGVFPSALRGDRPEKTRCALW
jgi:hypothetical protein